MLPGQNPPEHLKLPEPDTVEKTTIEVRLSVEKEAYFSLIFVAGTQARIVEANESITDNIGGIKDFIQDLISDKPLAYLEVDRLVTWDCLYVRKLNSRELLLQIFEVGHGEPEYDEDEMRPGMFVEAVVGYKKFIWELYTAFCMLPPMATGSAFSYYPKHDNKNWCKMPEIEAWLGLVHQANWHWYEDEIFGDEPCETPWTRI